MKPGYKKRIAGIYENELVRLLRKENIWACRIAGSGTGLLSLGDVMGDCGVIFEVKSLPDTKDKPFPVFSLRPEDREELPRIREIEKSYNLLYLYAIRVRSKSHAPKTEKWRFVGIKDLIKTQRGGIHADPNLCNIGTWENMVRFLHATKSAIARFTGTALLNELMGQPIAG